MSDEWIPNTQRKPGRPKTANLVRTKKLSPKEARLSKTLDIALSFMETLKLVETEQGKTFLKHCFERAYVDDKMAIALLKKIVPDLKMIESSVVANVDGKVIISTSLDLNEVLLQGLPKPPEEN